MLSHLKSFTRFADAATALAALTAFLYFSGYVYYNAFCGELGIHLHGIEISFEDYLMAGWDSIFHALAAVFGALIFSGLIGWGSGKITQFLRNRKISVDPMIWESCVMGGRLVAVSMTIFIALLNNVVSQTEAGVSQASKIRAEETSITLRDPNGEIIEGTFIYLRDFGGSLILGEQSEDQLSITGIRIFKEGNYSSYTLKKPEV